MPLIRPDNVSPDRPLEFVRSFTQALTRAAGVEEICETVLTAFSTALGTGRTSLQLPDAEGTLRMRFSRDVPDEYRSAAGSWMPWRPDEAAPRSVVLDFGDMEGPAAAARRAGLHAACLVPLATRDTVIGVVAAYYDAPVRPPPVRIELAETLAAQTAFALDRLLTDLTLLQTERMLSRFVFDAPIGLASLDPAGRVLWANQAQLDLLGHQAGEPIGRPFTDFLPLPGQRERIGELLRARRPLDNEEVRLLHADGSVRHVLISGRPVAGESGIAYMGCFIRDITARKREETEQQFLAEASRLLNASLDYAETLQLLGALAVPVMADWCLFEMLDDEGALRPVAVAHRDPGKVAFLREIRERYRPQAVERLPSTHVLRTGTSRMLPRVSDAMLQEFAADAEHLRSMRELAPGSVLLVPLSIRGDRIGILTWIRQADSPAYDARDLRLAEELARRASTAIEHARLYRDLQEASRLKDRFLANVSHELRTPLNAICGWARILLDQQPGPEAARRAVETIEQNARVQTRLIDDLLDVSRIISGKLQLRPVEVPLQRTIKAALETVRPGAEARGVELRLEEGSGETVTGDPDRLQQVFWNLISNAVKFTSRGGRVVVTQTCEASSAIVRVADTGAGIEPDLLPHLFEPFRQSGRRRDAAGRGLGLGLAIVRHIVEMHGGDAQASSEGEGRGATFTVRLPVRAVHLSGRDPSPASVRTTLDSLRILVVDDDADARDLLEVLLTSQGAAVRTAASAGDAVSAFEEEGHEVVVSDLHLKESDGLWLVRRIRETAAAGGRAPVTIAITAGLDDAARLAALQAGFRTCLGKPVEGGVLVATIASMVGHGLGRT